MAGGRPGRDHPARVRRAASLEAASSDVEPRDGENPLPTPTCAGGGRAVHRCRDGTAGGFDRASHRGRLARRAGALGGRSRVRPARRPARGPGPRHRERPQVDRGAGDSGGAPGGGAQLAPAVGVRMAAGLPRSDRSRGRDHGGRGVESGWRPAADALPPNRTRRGRWPAGLPIGDGRAWLHLSPAGDRRWLDSGDTGSGGTRAVAHRRADGGGHRWRRRRRPFAAGRQQRPLGGRGVLSRMVTGRSAPDGLLHQERGLAPDRDRHRPGQADRGRGAGVGLLPGACRGCGPGLGRGEDRASADHDRRSRSPRERRGRSTRPGTLPPGTAQPGSYVSGHEVAVRQRRDRPAGRRTPPGDRDRRRSLRPRQPLRAAGDRTLRMAPFAR